MIEEQKEGFTIRLGRSKTENARLLLDASPQDLWIHLSGHPSGHAVITHHEGKKFPRRVIKRAAVLVKQYSKRKSDKKVSCDVAHIKDLLPTKQLAEVSVSKFMCVVII